MYFSASVLHFNIQTQERKEKHKGKLTKRQALTVVMGWWATRGAMLKADAILTRLCFTAFSLSPKLVAQKHYQYISCLSVSTEILFIQINTNMGGKGKKKEPSF